MERKGRVSRRLWRGTARPGTSPNSSRRTSAGTTYSLRPAPSHLPPALTLGLMDTRPPPPAPPPPPKTPTGTGTRAQSRRAPFPTNRQSQSAANTTARKVAALWGQLQRKPMEMQRQKKGTVLVYVDFFSKRLEFFLKKRAIFLFGFNLVTSNNLFRTSQQILAEFAIATASFMHYAALTSHNNTRKITGKCLIHK